MKQSASRLIVGVMIAIILLIGTCAAGFIAGRSFTTFGGDFVSILPGFDLTPGGAGAPGSTSTPVDRDELFKPFWQAWDLVHAEYVDQPIDDEALMRGAIHGMLEALGDDHTSYMDPQTMEALETALQGEYEGIGAVVDTTTNYLTIISTYPDSPAEKAGLQAGDQIIAVDGEDMTGTDPELVRRQVIGPAGSKVKLTIYREGSSEPIVVDVTRAKIVLPDVEGEMLEGGIAYVQLNNFGDKTTKDLEDTLKELLKQDPKGLIVDLRNNGGGYLHVAVEVASQFIDEGVIVSEEFADGSRKEHEARGDGLATEIPMVMLINEGSASASEIVAGAIQDYKRGELVGVTSFGKGSAQVITNLVNKQGAVRITIARWLTPKDRTIHEVGLTPDEVVELTQEDMEADRDPQLDKAIYLLTR